MSYAALVAAKRDLPPPYLGVRFDADTRPLRDAGTTMIGHVPPGPVFEALVAARDTLAATTAGRCFAWLPPSSYHMTIYDCVLYRRRTTGFWPAELDPIAGEPQVESFVFSRLQPLRPERSPAPFRMVPEALEPAPGGAGVTVTLSAVDATEDRRIRAFRDRCAAALGLTERPHHDSYRFHITMAYGIAWPDDREAQAFEAALTEADAVLRAAAPLIEIGPPQLCRFADMTHFEVVSVLK